MDYERIREELDELKKEAVIKLPGVPKNNSVARAAVKQAIQKLDTLTPLYEKKDYRLVFIGEPGKGKTSIITNLFGLLPEELSKPFDKLGKPQASLMPVGSGGTTMPESIEICPAEGGENTFFNVLCCGTAELSQYISEYIECEYVTLLSEHISKHPSEDGKDPELSPPYMPREKRRYIENLCLPGIKKAYSEGNETLFRYRSREAEWEDENGRFTAGLKKFIPDAITGRNESEDIFNKRAVDYEVIKELTGFVFSLIELDGAFLTGNDDAAGNDVEIKIINSEGKNVKKFIKETLGKLNIGSYPGLSIIKKITLSINENELPLTIRRNDISIRGAVDTRGYRIGDSDSKNGSDKKKVSDTVRTDLIEYLSDPGGGNICLFTERYIDCSGGEMSACVRIMRYNMRSSFRTGLNGIVINWEKGQPSQNADSTGYYSYDDDDDYEKPDEKALVRGRIAQASEYMVGKVNESGSNVFFNKENVFAYDPLSGYGIRNNEIDGYDRNEAEKSREEFLDELFGMIKRDKEQLEDEITENYNLLRMFVDTGDVSALAVRDDLVNEFYNEAVRLAAAVGEEIKALPFTGYYREKIQGGFTNRAYQPLARYKGSYTGVNGPQSLSDINEQMLEFYSKHISEMSRLMNNKYDEIKEKCRGTVDSEKLLTILGNFRDVLSNELNRYEEKITRCFTAVIENPHFFGKAAPFWESAVREANEGGRGVNARIRNMFLERISEENQRELYGSFDTQCEKVQEAVCKDLLIIVDECFGKGMYAEN